MSWTTLARPSWPRLRAAAATQCEVCRGFGRQRLCDDCLSRHAPPRWRCGRCALPLATGQAACGTCLRSPPPWDRAVSAFDYVFPWDRLIADFKFRGRVDLAAVLAQRLADAVAAAPGAPADVVVPVPLSGERLAERGFNQAWEIARRAARTLGLRAEAAPLLRVVATAHQAELPRDERERNLRGAFVVDPGRRAGIAGRAVALVDDVLTTGATAREATLALQRGGAASVQVWTVARTG